MCVHGRGRVHIRGRVWFRCVFVSSVVGCGVVWWWWWWRWCVRTCVFAIACSPLAVRSALSCVRHMNVGIFGHLLRLSDTTSINLEPQVSAGVRTANYELRQLRHCDTATLRLASCDTVDCDTANKMQTATPCTATPRHRDTATCKLRHRGLRHCKQNAHCDTTTPRHLDTPTL